MKYDLHAGIHTHTRTHARTPFHTHLVSFHHAYSGFGYAALLQITP